MGESRLSAGRCITLACLVAAAAACDGDTVNDEDRAARAALGTDYAIDARTAEESMAIQTVEGRVAMRSGANVPIDLPAGFVLPPDALVTWNTVVDGVDGRDALIRFQAPLDLEGLRRDFREQVQAAGFALEIDRVIGGTLVFAGRSGRGDTFSFTATERAGTTRAELSVRQSGSGQASD